ncbi:MAG: translesion error-prone DNA polymerase V autoproteolytic subunit [Nitrospinota bacterium]|jgi:DNA polymerase V|nr:translesion error-prone DNA polymerase V autoproteolytic subunit [Nitrospinota bacterium]
MRIKAVFQAKSGRGLRLPLFLAHVLAGRPTGFPSPADDFIENRLDINAHLVKRPAATFFVRVQGDSMRDAGIHDGDILVVDRSLESVSGKIVVAVVDGEFTVKRLEMRGSAMRLLPENNDYRPTEITDGMELTVWGVVTSVIHAL